MHLAANDACLSAVIVDDEAIARRRLRRMLTRSGGVSVLGESSNGRTAVDTIRTLRPTLAFLDVHLPEMDGLSVARQLWIAGAEAPLVIFVTAHHEYAADAFDVSAVDYLVKPFGDDRLDAALSRARARLARGESPSAPIINALRAGRLRPAVAEVNPPTDVAAVSPPFVNRFAVRSSDRTLLVRADEVETFMADGNYVRVQVAAATYLMRHAIGALAPRLDPRRFVRVHRSTIVNLDRVRELQRWFSGDMLLVMHSGQKVRLSRSHRDAFARHIHW